MGDWKANVRDVWGNRQILALEYKTKQVKG